MKFSVERLYTQLWESGQPALEPLIIKTSGGRFLLRFVMLYGQ